MTTFTKLGAEICAPLDGSGNPRGASMSDMATWMTEVEAPIINAGRASQNVLALCGVDDPADVTSSLLTAALAADSSIRELFFPGGEYDLGGQVVITNRNMVIYGAGPSAVRIKCEAGVAPFKTVFTDIAAFVRRKVEIYGMNFHAMEAGCYGPDFVANLFPESKWSLYAYEDLDFTAEDATATFERQLRFKHAVQGSLHNIRGTNGVLGGAGYEYQGFALANTGTDFQIINPALGITITPFVTQYIAVTGRSGSIVAGNTVTTSGGATGVIAGVAGTDSFAVEVLTGIFAVGHTITASNGMTATIDVSTEATWNAEGFSFSHYEIVGTQVGIDWNAGQTTLKKGVLLKLNDGHINASVAPLRLGFLSQVIGRSNSFYGNADGVDMMYLTACDNVDFDKSNELTYLPASGSARGVVVVDSAQDYPVSLSSEIDCAPRINNIATPYYLSPAIDPSGIRLRPSSKGEWTAYTPNVSASGGAITAVGATDVRYDMLSEGTMILRGSVAITTAGVTGGLRVSIPAGYTLKGWNTAHGKVESTGKAAYGSGSDGNTFLEFYAPDTDGNASSFIADGAVLSFSATIEVQ